MCVKLNIQHLHYMYVYSVMYLVVCTYRICLNRSRAQIEAGAGIEAGSERSVS